MRLGFLRQHQGSQKAQTTTVSRESRSPPLPQPYARFMRSDQRGLGEAEGRKGVALLAVPARVTRALSRENRASNGETDSSKKTEIAHGGYNGEGAKENGSAPMESVGIRLLSGSA